MYYIITSTKKKKVLATINLYECFEFIKVNKDAKVRTMNHTAKPRLIDKRLFIKRFLDHTGNENRTFVLVDLMIKGVNNQNAFLIQNDLKEKYDQFKKITDKNL